MSKIVSESVKYVSHQRHSVPKLVKKMKEFGVGPGASKDLIVDLIL